MNDILFYARHNRCYAHAGALTLVISDGWDCGDIGVLREEIARLQRSSRRLIWLNPLLADLTERRPECRQVSIRSALPSPSAASTP